MASQPSGAPRIEVFSGPGCAYCARTRSLLEENGLAYREYDTAAADDLEEFRKRLRRLRSLPQIFIDGEHVGSWEDLADMESDGRLRALGLT